MAKPTDPDWAAALVDVKPLKGRRLPAVTKPPVRLVIRPPDEVLPLQKGSLPPLALYESAGVDAQTYKRFRSGRMPIEGRLDLHGETRASAEASLHRFLKFSLQRKRRCLLVITGKSGVLRQTLPAWLDEPGWRPHILAITEAQPEDGGSGAFYILLRRQT